MGVLFADLLICNVIINRMGKWLHPWFTCDIIKVVLMYGSLVQISITMIFLEGKNVGCIYMTFLVYI